MILFAIFFGALLIGLLYLVYRIINDPIKEEQNKQKYNKLRDKIESKIEVLKDYRTSLVKKQSIERLNNFDYKYLPIINDIYANYHNHHAHRLKVKNGKMYYPIKEMKAGLNKLYNEFPEVFIMENRDRKLNLILKW
jgi:competence CoiA-like predicted nuclease